MLSTPLLLGTTMPLEAPIIVVQPSSVPEVHLYTWRDELAKDSCQTLIKEYGRFYGLSEPKIEEAYQTMRRESEFHEQAPNPTDSHKGSWGCAQINLDAHPQVTQEQAQNKYFASRFMAYEFSQGHESKWTCWNEWYGGKPKKNCPQK